MSNHTKKILRERILTLLRDQEDEERLIKSLAIKTKLFGMLEFKNAETILFYASFDGEVETFEMMREALKLGKKIGLPGVVKDGGRIVPKSVTSLEVDLEKGPYGIKQPKKESTRTLREEQIDMVIVPGVVFDEKNNRLGRGGGYYDRFLGSLPERVPTIGLAFDFQIVGSLPSCEDHDVPVSCVVTN